MKLPKLAVAIMAVPERAERVTRLLQHLGLPDDCVTWDKNHNGHMANWWRAVGLAAVGNPSHVLILEDDAEPCTDFLPAVEKLVTRYPHRIISFFTGQTAAAPVNPNTLTLIPHYRHLSDVAVVYPLAWLQDLRCDFDAKRTELEQTTWQINFGADEVRVKLRPQQQVWVTLPSLVQHGCPQDSVLKHVLPHGIARPFIGHGVSAFSLRWGNV
jgi:hypothetical protein